MFNRATLPLKGKLIVYVAVSHARHLTQDPCHMLTGLTAIKSSFDVLQPSLGIRVPKHQKQKSLENKISLSAFIPTVNDGDFPPKKLNWFGQILRRALQDVAVSMVILSIMYFPQFHKHMLKVVWIAFLFFNHIVIGFASTIILK